VRTDKLFTKTSKLKDRGVASTPFNSADDPEIRSTARSARASGGLQ
jgi:hypothetical protein